MFRSSTVIRELPLNLAEVIFMLKHSVKLRRYILSGCVAACNGMTSVLHTGQNATESHSEQQTETCRSNIYVYFNVNFSVFLKLIKVNLLVSKLTYIRMNSDRIKNY